MGFSLKTVKPILKMASKSLKEFLNKHEGECELGFVQINCWLEENNFPFELDFDERNWRVIIKLKKEEVQNG